MPDYQNIDLHKIARETIEQYGFDFNPAKSIIDEVNALDPQQLLNNAQGVRDLCSLLWSSIDNAESLDLDQLECCERGAKDCGRGFVCPEKISN